MNLELLNPFAQDFPDKVDASLDASGLFARFNPSGRFAGHYLAIGRVDGCVTVIDIETKGLLKFLEGHVKSITAICWSRNGRYLLSASRDWNVIIWDLVTSERRETVRFDAIVTSAQLHPRNSKIILVTLQGQQQAVLVDLRSNGGRYYLDISNAFKADQNPDQSQAEAPKKRKEWCNVAKFSPRGDMIFVGTTQGNLHIFNPRTKTLVRSEKVSNGSSVKHLEFDRKGTSLAINSNDRSIKVYSLVGGLKLEYNFQDRIDRTPWNGCGFSNNGEYVIGGTGHKTAHDIHIWNRATGALVKILQGPKDPLEDIEWHPVRPVVVSVSSVGLVHIWVNAVTEHWSAYAPEFEELEENVEYEEGEDEFDIEDESVAKRRQEDEHARSVDILTLGRGDAPPSVDDFGAHSPDEDDKEDFFPLVDHLDDVEVEEDLGDLGRDYFEGTTPDDEQTSGMPMSGMLTPEEDWPMEDGTYVDVLGQGQAPSEPLAEPSKKKGKKKSKK